MPGEDLLLLANLFLGLLCKLWLGMQHDLEKWELWKRICCGFPLAFLLKIDYNTIRLFIESFIIGRAKHLFGHVAGGSCAAGRCEPCQAGNRAALTGVSLCDADSLSVRISKRMTPRPRPVLLSIYLLERGENFVSGALPQVAA